MVGRVYYGNRYHARSSTCEERLRAHVDGLISHSRLLLNFQGIYVAFKGIKGFRN
jgi:hypothetical protein